MNRLPIERRTLILRCLTDGCSIRATSRITGHARNTISKLLIDVGGGCEQYQHQVLRDLHCHRLETDELWTFCGCKAKGLKRGKHGEGSIWTWVALDPVTKLVPTWLVGDRSASCARAFMNALAECVLGRPQLTTDGHMSYPDAVEEAFGSRVDYGVLIKQYQGNRYVGSIKQTLGGVPNLVLLSTSHVERQNLTMRMNMRRFTRRTNGFSKKLANLEKAVALHFMHYNFSRIHQSLGVSPAMAAGVTKTLWETEDIVRLAA